LSEEHIQAQTLPELKQSLERMNQLIENLKQSIGATHFKSELEGQASIYTMPLLLERQKMVIDRIRQLESEEEITKLVTVARSDAATDVEQGIAHIKSMNETWVAVSLENERARNEALEAANKISEETLHRQDKAAEAKGRWPAMPKFIEKRVRPYYHQRILSGDHCDLPLSLQSLPCHNPTDSERCVPCHLGVFFWTSHSDSHCSQTRLKSRFV
jgi:hypothetical protein